MRDLSIGLLMSLLHLAPACSENNEDARSIGANVAALAVGDEVRFYFGPGVSDEVARIEAGLPVAEGYIRIAVPRSKVPTSAPLDLATPVAIEYWEHTRVAWGCSTDPTPFTGKWSSGQPGVSGRVEALEEGPGVFQVAYSFVYEGPFTSPCGTFNLGHSSGNLYPHVAVGGL
jgi:hypothetical protein